MNLWISGLLLMAGFVLNISALSYEECKALITPKPVWEPMYGRWTFMVGYTENPVFVEKFRLCQSQWIDFLPSGTPNTVIEDVALRTTAGCKGYTSELTIMGNLAIGSKFNFTCTYHSIPTIKGCVLYHVTALNNNNLVTADNPTLKEELRGYKTFYLLCTKQTISDKDRGYVMKQAECLGYKGEPHFMYDPKDTFCHEGIDPWVYQN